PRLEDLAAVLAAHRLVDPVGRDPQHAVAVRALRLHDLTHRFTCGRPGAGANHPRRGKPPLPFRRYFTSIGSAAAGKRGPAPPRRHSPPDRAPRVLAVPPARPPAATRSTPAPRWAARPRAEGIAAAPTGPRAAAARRSPGRGRPSPSGRAGKSAKSAAARRG